MNVQIQPGRLSGTVKAPPSKSAAHRAAICAALSQGKSVISGVELTQDMLATIEAANALGATCAYSDGVLTVEGISSPSESASIDCNESGSTLRFFVPIAAALGVSTSFSGKGKLPQRPMDPLISAMQPHGVDFGKQGDEILSVKGKLQSGTFRITGSVSSQYITGLLFALPLLSGDSSIYLTAPLQSVGYIDMTLQMMERFGIQVSKTSTGYRIPGGQQYHACGVQVEGDYSAAAFWLCAGAINSEITIQGLRQDSLQGDRQILSIVEKMGAQLTLAKDSVHISPGRLQGIEVDIGNIPDLAPAIASAAAYAAGSTVLLNAARLRIKECDRIAAVKAGLTAIGSQVLDGEDRMEVIGKTVLQGGTEVSSYNDHRIAMAMCIATLGCREPVTILDAKCVEKSYLHFYRDFAALGGVCHVL